jgi:hypothetical protein
MVAFEILVNLYKEPANRAYIRSEDLGLVSILQETVSADARNSMRVLQILFNDEATGKKGSTSSNGLHSVPPSADAQSANQQPLDLAAASEVLVLTNQPMDPSTTADTHAMDPSTTTTTTTTTTTSTTGLVHSATVDLLVTEPTDTVSIMDPLVNQQATQLPYLSQVITVSSSLVYHDYPHPPSIAATDLLSTQQAVQAPSDRSAVLWIRPPPPPPGLSNAVELFRQNQSRSFCEITWILSDPTLQEGQLATTDRELRAYCGCVRYDYGELSNSLDDKRLQVQYFMIYVYFSVLIKKILFS